MISTPLLIGRRFREKSDYHLYWIMICSTIIKIDYVIPIAEDAAMTAGF